MTYLNERLKGIGILLQTLLIIIKGNKTKDPKRNLQSTQRCATSGRPR